MKIKYNLIPKKLKLSKGEVQDYFIDENPKANFAEYRKEKKQICVNKRFETLSEREKVAILYHERGHSNFYLWKLFHEMGQFFFCISVSFFMFPGLFILINMIAKIKLFNVSNLIWIILMISGIFYFGFFIGINYLLESIADIYSVAKTNDKTLINIVKREYKDKKSWWDKYILHPSPDLREDIIELILKW